MFIYHFLLQDSNWKKEELMLPYSQLMGKDIAALLECSAILLCKGWEKSKGCRLEKATADIYDLEVLFEE